MAQQCLADQIMGLYHWHFLPRVLPPILLFLPDAAEYRPSMNGKALRHFCSSHNHSAAPRHIAWTVAYAVCAYCECISTSLSYETQIAIHAYFQNEKSDYTP